MVNLRIHCPVKGAALVNCMHTLQLPLSQLQNKRVNFLPSKLGRKTICTTLVKLDRRAADKFYGQPQAPASSPAPAPAPAPARARWCVTKFTAEQLPPHRSATRLLLFGWPAIHKHLQFIAHLPTKYRPIQGTFNGVCGGASSHWSYMGALWV